MRDELLESYTTVNAESDLAAMIGAVKEDLHLEFKTKKDSRVGDLEKEDARNFSKCLSGFANSDGGILYWGVETDSNEVAKELKPIVEVGKFLIALKKSIQNATHPVVDGILLEVIQSSTQNAGFIKCYIPSSNKTPHRAVLAEREYYKRSVEGFYRLEHFDLEDMFGRRQKPHLLLNVVPVSISEGGGIAIGRKKFSFRLLNEGRNIARFCSVHIKSTEDIVLNSLNGFTDISHLNDNRLTFTWSDNFGVIHPNGLWHHLGDAVLELKDKGTNSAIITVRISCENMIPIIENITIPFA